MTSVVPELNHLTIIHLGIRKPPPGPHCACLICLGKMHVPLPASLYPGSHWWGTGTSNSAAKAQCLHDHVCQETVHETEHSLLSNLKKVHLMFCPPCGKSSVSAALLLSLHPITYSFPGRCSDTWLVSLEEETWHTWMDQSLTLLFLLEVICPQGVGFLFHNPRDKLSLAREEYGFSEMSVTNWLGKSA